VTVGDFAAVVAALTSVTAYANIHTKAFPAGEIRGQIHPERHRREFDGRGAHWNHGQSGTTVNKGDGAP
jgi:hypothetical protein